MKSHYEAEQIIRDIKKKICGIRNGVYYISNSLDWADKDEMTTEQMYNAGYKEGLWDGLEMSLGMVEDLEEEWTDESDL